MRILIATVAFVVTALITTASAATNDPMPSSQPAADGTTPATGKATPATEQDKVRDCEAKWKAAKAEGTTHGKSHRKFKAACLKG